MLTRAPCSALRPFISQLWAGEASDPRGARERVLPTGTMHLVFRFCAPLRLFEHPDDPVPHTLGHAIVGGARSSAYVRDTSVPSSSVGAQLVIGASRVVLGVPADVLAERHVALPDLWGNVALEMLERLEHAGSAQARLDLLERMLLARLPRVRGVHPSVALAIARFAAGVPVAAVASESGYSHRGFATVFEREVGLAPKRFCRIQRLQSVLAAPQDEPWAQIAVASGYADQSHLHREVREISGMTLAAYRRAAPVYTHHVPLPFPSRLPGESEPPWRTENHHEDP